MIDLAPDQVAEITALLIGRVGDLIVASPFLRSLNRYYAKARIRLIISSLCEETATLIPFVDDVSVIHRFHKVLPNLKLAAALMRKPCDLLVDLNPSFSRTSAALASMISAPIKLSFAKGQLDSLFTHQVPAAGEKEPMRDRYARLAAELGAPYDPQPELRLNPADEARAQRIISGIPADPGGLRVLIHPGNFKKFENRWPEDKFAELGDILLKDPALRLYFMAGPGEEAKVSELVSHLAKPVPMIPPVPIGVAGGLMRHMDLCVLNITGTTHLAAALDAPTFGFYSGYTDAVWRPLGPRHTGVVSSSWESCRDIPVETAAAALKAALQGLGPRKA